MTEDLYVGHRETFEGLTEGILSIFQREKEECQIKQPESLESIGIVVKTDCVTRELGHREMGLAYLG